MKKYFICIVVISAIMALTAISAFSQDPAEDDMAAGQVPQAAMGQTPQDVPAEAAAQMNELSIYGEVQAVNVPASSISVQYYDYDNDEEKVMELSLDKDSKLENVKAIDEVKRGDWVDATYTTSGGKSTAKMVIVEAEEPIMDDDAPVDIDEE